MISARVVCVSFIQQINNKVLLSSTNFQYFFCSSTSPTPPLSLMSNSTTTTTASGSTTALSAPLQPDPSLTPPKRPNRFLGFFPAAKPLSPITSSPEMSPNAESSPAFPARQKQLHFPHLLSKLVPSGSLTSLVKVRT